MSQHLFDLLKQKNIETDEIINIAQAMQNANFSDEQTVSQLIDQLQRLAGQSISPEQKQQLVNTITNNKLPNDMNALSQWFNL
ncbi:Stage VI sporulation protein F [Pelagirhabdus alkalitolerans]|uniref:Stage VI sporulation protein F n=1 Tax=Pelagirhabdus alkalitolerans TaxID=1612202 RepID=A0A1G6HD59_9BACI|nr:stage VI sporulation protein F [Pelagirhabdus alkalitolerans]SDB91366.1 Stage VI sporulation protein F [Pelagirhabdus alkalitolerans]